MPIIRVLFVLIHWGKTVLCHAPFPVSRNIRRMAGQLAGRGDPSRVILTICPEFGAGRSKKHLILATGNFLYVFLNGGSDSNPQWRAKKCKMIYAVEPQDDAVAARDSDKIQIISILQRLTGKAGMGDYIICI